jgi:pSer/pThr/pTyr-binding forkhead associated (FHA) protein
MAHIDSPMLFLPPRPPLQIPPDRSLIIGRSRSCDLRLPSGDASRRHAEIFATNDGYVVQDLGSTNGTFVNGEQVREHVLQPGDRIQIAASTVTFCHVGGDPEMSNPAHADEQTLLSERPVPGEVFQGELAEIPSFAVLQILEMGCKTGVVQMECEKGSGRLWFVDGCPVHAETKFQVGFDAAMSLVNSTAGRFSFEPGVKSDERTIEASVTELLLEASRILDEELA